MSSHIKICVIGAHGTPNIGDQSILVGLLSILGVGKKPKTINVISRHPRVISHIIDGAASVPASSLFYLRTFIAVVTCDVFILGGGGIIQDQTSIANLLYYSFYTLLASALNKKIMAIGIGVGPFSHAMSRWIVRFMFFRIKKIYVRDNYSQAELKSIVGESRQVNISPDLAFLAKPDEDAQLHITKPQEKNRFRLGINLRPWLFKTGGLMPVSGKIHNQSWEKSFSELMGELSAQLIGFGREHPTTLVFLPFEPVQDNLAFSILSRNLPEGVFTVERPECKNPSEMFKLYGTLDACVGMRFHCLIFSIISHKPFIALNYNAKVKALVHEVDMENFSFTLDKSSLSHVGDSLRMIYSEYRDLQQRLLGYSQQYRSRLLEIGSDLDNELK